jgi:TonB-linked SusC/RagA family outer membrane protein
MRRKFKFCFMVICFMLTGAIAFAQQGRRITGTVTDTQGEALIGASVSIQGTSVGTVTDEVGKFSLPSKAGDVLSIASIGYESTTVKVSGQSDYSIQLKDNEQALSEVVVVGYGTLEKRQVTNAITSLSARDLPQGVGGSTIATAMQGKVGNLIINEGGTDAKVGSPNATPDFQLRGMASYNSNKGPLIVIDGMPGGDIRSVAQEDIQSIDILKDASAGAIYGTRAIGGVIMITTKKAQEGKMRLSYTGETTYKQAYGKQKFLTPEEFIEKRVPLGFTNYSDPNGAYYDPEHTYFDWYDGALNDNPLSYRHNVSINGGSATAKIYANFAYEENNSVVIGDSKKDISGRVNGNFKLVDGWLDINTHLDYRQAKRDQRSINPVGVRGNNPTKHPDNKKAWADRVSPLAPTNPFDDYNKITNDALDKWFRPDVELVLNVLPVQGLTAHYTLAYENRQWEHWQYEPKDMAYTEYVNKTQQGTAMIEFAKDDYMTVNGFLSYARKFGEDHNLNAVAGYEYYESNGESHRMENYGFSMDAVGLWNIGEGTYLRNVDLNGDTPSKFAEMVSKKDITQKLFSLFARANYSLKDRYLISGTVRRDETSMLVRKTHVGYFGQASAGWRLSKEAFLSDIDWLNDLKLRFAYGMTGNDPLYAPHNFDKSQDKGLFATQLYQPSSNKYLVNGNWITTWGPQNNIDPNLTWEKKQEYNVGLEYELFDSRLFGKIDYYRRNSIDLVFETPSGAAYPLPDKKVFTNIGTMRNNGWEIEIGGKIIDTKDWQYVTKMNISHNETKIVEMGDGVEHISAGNSRFDNGVTVGSFFIFKHAGISRDDDLSTPDDEATYYRDANREIDKTNPVPAGYLLIYDKDGNIVEPKNDPNTAYYNSDENRQYIGNYTPKAIIGWSHDLQWKNWSLGMTLTSWIDFDIYNSAQQANGLQAPSGNDGNILAIAYEKNKDITQKVEIASSYFLEDGTFLKIQNLSLGYKINTKKYLKVLESARLYCTVNNVYTFTKYSGYDPEVIISGWQYGRERVNYPLTRSYALGVQLTF